MKKIKVYAPLRIGLFMALLAQACTNNNASPENTGGNDTKPCTNDINCPSGFFCNDENECEMRAEPVGGDDRCEQNMDCDDGLFCNGEEICNEGMCEAGTAPDCEDNIECTTDLCSNALARCVHQLPDEDNDGVFDANCTDGEGTTGQDCDDQDPNRYPGNLEVCDESHHDEDCNLETFGAVDFDRDGFFSSQCCNLNDENELNCGEDCNDARRNIHPEVPEVCDGVDNNCDGSVDNGLNAIEVYPDLDGDGQGDKFAEPISNCGNLGLYSNNKLDCDDTDIERRDGLPEITDGKDNDCDGQTDESESSVDWYPDRDGDGFGDPNGNVINATRRPQIEVNGTIVNYSFINTDCNDDPEDGGGAINPAALEICDGRDNDCDGSIGQNEDNDGDGILNQACGGPQPDCDDFNPNTGFGSEELCDGQDNDCDRIIDEDVVSIVWFPDRDDDGFGTSSLGDLTIACVQPEDREEFVFVRVGGDCNDHDSHRSPAAEEACNASDDDCDGFIDEGESADAQCFLPRATGYCDLGSCYIHNCLEGNQDCNGEPADGCEVESQEIRACENCVDNNFQDCDMDRSNGCEADTRFDENHCGGCGQVCEIANGAGQCLSGQCIRTACDFSFGDCVPDDIEGAEGCETNLTNSASHCGGCGNSCGLGGECLNGRCDGIREIALGGSHTCVLRESGRVLCWGNNEFGQIGVNSESEIILTPTLIEQDADGNDFVDILQITAGEHHTCAVKSNGSLFCWGKNDVGQLGIEYMQTGPDNYELRPEARLPYRVSTLGIGNIIKVRAGTNFTCAQTSQGGFACWGATAHSQVLDVTNPALSENLEPYYLLRGQPATESYPFPYLRIPAPITFSDFSTGDGFICGFDSESHICWGRNDHYQLARSTVDGGDDDDLPDPSATEESIDFRVEDIAQQTMISISSGGGRTCSMLESTLGVRSIWCWGQRLFAPQPRNAWQPVPLEGNQNVEQVLVSQNRICSLSIRERGVVECVSKFDGGIVDPDQREAEELGRDNPSQFGFYEFIPTTAPSAITQLPSSASTAEHMCVLTLNGNLYCWGKNDHGQTGSGEASELPIEFDQIVQVEGL